ncbi:GntR family transcriptional regulator [Clostridium autoethanogenum]|uniref:GntR family transcriptional regulator n=1 Tax=Clostridium autoethanogenum TaxID=84023 RepID=A0A3M0SNC5_9CLOT|nr:GntR family transcriptional regulator [Clostridium autoethanogenum]RMD00013.1 GntR family transcriptional regulator [Clostridium autoethanogenum]
MEIKINRKSKIALYIQIENQIKNIIYSKILSKNYTLPSERQLANTLKVNRSTIIKAYEELKEKGLIDSNARRGTYISFCDNHEENYHKKCLFWDEIYSNREVIHQIIYNELCKGIIKDSSKEKYKKIINKLCLNGAEGIVLGCTEIPLLIKQEDVNIPIFDTTAIHAVSAVELALD